MNRKRDCMCVRAHANEITPFGNSRLFIFFFG